MTRLSTLADCEARLAELTAEADADALTGLDVAIRRIAWAPRATGAAQDIARRAWAEADRLYAERGEIARRQDRFPGSISPSGKITDGVA